MLLPTESGRKRVPPAQRRANYEQATCSLICLVSPFDCNDPKRLVNYPENHAIITYTESVRMRAGERFCKLEWFWAHLRCDTFLSLARQSCKVVFCGRSKQELHTSSETESFKHFFLRFCFV